MNKWILYIVALCCALLAAVSCSKEEQTDAQAGAKGTMTMKISATRTDETPAYDPKDHLTVRIYNTQGLVRKYTSKEEMPASLELLAGEYRVTVEAGETEKTADKSAASFDIRLYKGEQAFTVEAGKTTAVEVLCKCINTVVEVKFDESVTKNFNQFSTWVAVGDVFDEEKAISGEIPALHYTANARGYFDLLEGQTSLAWHFSGEHKTRGVIEKDGVMTAVKQPGKYVLTLTFSPDLPGYIQGFPVSVDPSTDDQDDTLVFSPDPVIEGIDFDMAETQVYLTGDKQFSITTVKPMKEAQLLIDGQTIDLIAAVDGGIAGITATKPNVSTLNVTLSDAFFTGRSGGNHTLRFGVNDTAGGTITTSTTFRLQGIAVPTAADWNLWTNTITLHLVQLASEISAPTFGLRIPGGDWQTVEGVQQADGSYTATFTAGWTQSTNDADLAVYTPIAGTGVFAGNNYECRAVIDGVTSAASFSTAAGDAIYNSGMDMWTTYKVTGSSATGGTVAYPNENSSTVFWAGSNNGNTPSLCTGQSIEGNNGSKCAQLHPQAATGDNFAAGSLFMGSIDFGTGLFDMFGFARFGVKYTFTARPKALRVHYKAIITKVTHTGKSSLTKDDYDPARIFVVVTDWKDRHAVKSGVSADASTFWDPAKANSLDEGAILGYGSKWVTASTNGWVTEELPILWYDKDAAPGQDSYSLSISAASSAYGDYMAGSLDNYLYIEDFEWVY